MISRAKIFETSIRFQEESFDELLDTLKRRRTDVADHFRSVQGADEEYIAALEMEAAEVNGWLVEMAEITMVAVYHWVERELKAMAAWFPGQKLASIQKLNAEGSATAFKKVGNDLRTAARYKEINLLRLFANSWKHNVRRPSEKLLKELGLRSRRAEHGLLSNDRVERGMRKALGLASTDVTCFDITRAMITCAREFLVDVVRTAPLRK